MSEIREANLKLQHTEWLEGITRLSSMPSRAQIILGDLCNSRCRMCYLGVLNGNRDTSYTPPKRFSSNEIAELHEISKFFRDVQFTGDEPTVHRDLPELMDIFSKDPEITISLSTNLFDISDEIIKRLEIGRRQLTISVDTPNLRLYEKIRGVPMSGLLANLGRLPPNPDMKLSLSVVIQKINLMELRTCWNGPL